MYVSTIDTNHQQNFKGYVSNKLKRFFKTQAEIERSKIANGSRPYTDNYSIIRNIELNKENILFNLKRFAQKLHSDLKISGEYRTVKNKTVLQSLKISHPLADLPIRTTKCHYDNIDGQVLNNYIYLKDQPYTDDSNLNTYNAYIKSIRTVNTKQIETALLNNMITSLKNLALTYSEVDTSFLFKLISKIQLKLKMNRIERFSKDIGSEAGLKKNLKPIIDEIYNSKTIK